MSDSLDPRDDLTERLAALGRAPVTPAVQSEHLTAIASVASGRSFRTSLAGRLKVGAGVLAGFLLGASGLTAAGALGPLQPVAAKVASEVANVEVPQGPKDKAEKAEKAKKAKAAKARLADGSIGTARDWSDSCADTGTPGQYAGNRGQYLKQERAKGAEALAAAKASTCGMPLGAEKDAEDAGDDEPKAESEGRGKPEDSPAQNDGAGQSDDEHGKAPGADGKDGNRDGNKAKGPKTGDDGEAAKPETPAGPPAEAGNSGVTPPVESTPAEPTPDTPAPATEDDGEV